MGGENSLTQTRDYATRLHDQRPLDAWTDSVKDSKQQELNLEQEPRIKPEKLDQPILADHPFFWAGMMLVEVPNDKTANSPADPSADPPLPGQPQGPGQVPPPDDAGLMKQDDQKAEDQKAEDQKGDRQKGGISSGR